ncbi:MAG: response regulator [Synechococcales cyanobacterium C42_A2020_086]|jgi:chemotaxis family two-component system sensor histidine kinase/response regulator PixL|nr:response regulator [Synechococcales cyanobacterium C42_A2020_086]
MALNPDIRDQAYQFFMEEAPDLLQVIETGLLSLHHERSTAQIHTLMRSAHSLKGGAASVGLDAVAALAHRLENLFKALYNDALDVDTELENQLFQAYDCLRLPLMEQIRTGTCNWEMALAVAEPVFSQIERRCGDALTQAVTYIPSSVDMGIDMVVSIFEVDVAQGLERLATVLSQPENYQVAGELRAQIEVFAGFAELLSLPNFGAIASMVQQALDAFPERSVEIAELALIDFERSRQSVLAGDRMGGPGPSPALVALAQGTEIERVDLAFQDGSLENLHDTLQDALTNDFMKNLDALTEAEALNLENSLETNIENSLESVDTHINDSSEQYSSELTESALTEDMLSPAADWHTAVHSSDRTGDPLADALPLLHDLFGNLELAETADELETERDHDRADLPDASNWVADLHPDAPAEPENATQPSAAADVPPASPAEPSSQSFALNSTVNFRTTEAPSDPFSESADAAAHTRAEVSRPANLPSSPWKPWKSMDLRQTSLAPSLTVRVDADRLERMNNLVGELAINRSSLALQNEQTQRVVRELRNRFARFQAVVNHLQGLSDQLLIASERSPILDASVPLSRNAEPRLIPQRPDASAERSYLDSMPDYASLSAAVGVEFDPLEMDRYSPLYLQVQEILEELMQLEESVEDIALFARQSHQIMDQQQHMMMQLRDELVWARMLPIGEIINRFPRLMRDLSVTYHKPVALTLTGTEVLIDRAILEKLYDPLLHLLRNAFDHGIEPPELRQQRGKPETGQIELRAFHKGNQTVIEVRDDGQGLNLERIRERSVELGWLSSEQAMLTPPAQLFELIFEPGFSTSKQINELSGRGFGLDVVRSQLQAIKGTVSVTSAPGKGTTFTLYLPLTLTITQLIICMVGTLPFALPAEGIADLLSPQPMQIQQMGSQPMLHWREQTIPIYSLASLLHYACPLPDASNNRVWATVLPSREWASPILVLRQEHQFFALQVDRILMEQEMVIKPFGAALAPPSYMFGCSILGDGSPVPVIDAAALLTTWLNQDPDTITVISPSESQFAERAAQGSPTLPTAVQPAPAPTVLVVDDAVTLRRTMALFLEREGFRVLQAQDGQEAVEQLQQMPSVQLIICDIEMPNMNGFEFLSYRRQHPSLASVPVVILTSRSNEKHRWLAMQLGATAYFTKPYLEHEFLSTLKTLI